MYRKTFTSHIKNNSKVQLKVTARLVVEPHYVKAKMKLVSKVTGWLKFFSGLRRGKGFLDSAADGVGQAYKADDVFNIARRNNKTKYITETVLLEPNTAKTLTVSTGHISNGIRKLEGKLKVSWPKGRIYDPQGCIDKWKRLQSGLASRILISYKGKCHDNRYGPHCEYGRAVSKGNQISKLRKICNNYKKRLIGVTACARIKRLNLINQAQK